MKRITILLLTALALPYPSEAFTIVIIPSGTTEPNTVTLANPGDSLLVEAGGAIEPPATDVGVDMTAADQLTLNQGQISTTGDNARGILSSGADATITSSGQISTTGSVALGILSTGAAATITSSGQISTTGIGAFGIFSDGANATITSSGQISTTGNFADGIQSTGAAPTITNSCQISTTGDDASGIFSAGANATITNSGQISTTEANAFGIRSTGAAATITSSGQISTTGAAAHGIFSFGIDATITSSGQISTTGDNASGIFSTNVAANATITNSCQISAIGNTSFGIFSAGVDATITNSGQICVFGPNGDGVRSQGNNPHLINSGTIKSQQAAVIRSTSGTSMTLTLLRGSNLQGSVVVNAPLNLNVETGLNLALTLDPVGSGFNNLGISTPFVLAGQTIAVVDPTGLALQADVTADLSDAILDGIYRHRVGFPCQCIPCGCGAWIQGIGSYRKRSRNAHAVGYENWQGGFLVGYDASLCKGNVSVFGGVSFGEAEVDECTQRAETTSYVGGVAYERLFCNTFLGVALVGGYVDWDNRRFVMNNLVLGGVEKAEANTGGGFISSEATVGHRFTSFWLCPVASFTLRYAGLFLGDYSEEGSLANLSVKSRNIQLLTTRFEFSLPYTVSRGLCCWSIEPYLGVFGRYQVDGKDVDAELLGQSLQFNSGISRNLAAFLVGCRGVQSYGRFNLFLNIEASFDSARSSRILGEGGIGYSF